MVTGPSDNPSEGSPAPQSPEAWAETLKADWERRAQSPSRDFYVASHRGWNDEQRWQEQARVDLQSFLLELDVASLKQHHALEIGCGVGRIARPLADLVQTYTGFDIAPGMVAEARERSADLGDAVRFFEGTGLVVPEPARDRQYGFVLSLAVFIHCPKDVIESLTRDAWSLMAPGGVFRAQFLGNPADSVGIDQASASNVEQLEQVQSEVTEETTEEQRELIDDHPYMGHGFGYEELEQMLLATAPGASEQRIFRPHAEAIYVSLRR